MSYQALERLNETIRARIAAGAEDSYVAKLCAKGTQHIAKKLGEEAVETAMAASANDASQVVYESADLLFHLYVLWAQMGIEPNQVMDELARREGVSGLTEKSNRKDV